MGAESFALYAVIGVITGFFAGLLGIGGGTIVTPLLIGAFAGIFPAETVTHAAVATSLAVIFFTSAPGAVSHARRGAADWKVVGRITAGAAFGSTAAAFSAANIPGEALNLLLAAFLLRTSYSMFRPVRAARFLRVFAEDKLLPLVGAGTGALAALLGIGAAVLTSPFLAARGMPIKRAIGTWAVYNHPMSGFAAAGYIAAGVQAGHESLPNYTVGYVYLPAFLGITVFGMLFAAVGARQTVKLPDVLLRRLFGAVVGILAVRLLYITLWA